VPELERTLGYGSCAFDRYCIAEMDTRADKRQVEGKSTTRAFAPASSLRNLSLSMCYWSRRRGAGVGVEFLRVRRSLYVLREAGYEQSDQFYRESRAGK